MALPCQAPPIPRTPPNLLWKSFVPSSCFSPIELKKDEGEAKDAASLVFGACYALAVTWARKGSARTPPKPKRAEAAHTGKYYSSNMLRIGEHRMLVTAEVDGSFQQSPTDQAYELVEIKSSSLKKKGLFSNNKKQLPVGGTTCVQQIKPYFGCQG